MNVNILGTNYEIVTAREYEDIKLEGANGYCETYSKKIVIEDFPEHPQNVENIEDLMKKVLRHEIIHAYLFESGLGSNSDWARNEEVVDWIALQAPKLVKAFKEVGALPTESVR